MKVLWISRHRPGMEESELLSSILEGAEILPISGTVPNTWSLTKLLDVHQPDAVVATLPFDMQEVLSAELKHREMRPLIRPLYRHRRLGVAPDQIDHAEWEFQGFEEVLEITVSTRPLLAPKKERTTARTKKPLKIKRK